MRSTLCFLFSLEAAGSFLTSPRHHAAAKGSRSCPSAFRQGQDRPGNIFGLPWHRKPAIALVDGRTAPTDRSRQLPSCRASVWVATRLRSRGSRENTSDVSCRRRPLSPGNAFITARTASIHRSRQLSLAMTLDVNARLGQAGIQKYYLRPRSALRI